MGEYVDKLKQVLEEVGEQRLNMENNLVWLLHQKRTDEFNKFVDKVIDEGNAAEIIRMKQVVRNQMRDMEAEIQQMVSEKLAVSERKTNSFVEEHLPQTTAQSKNCLENMSIKKNNTSNQNTQKMPNWYKTTVSAAAKTKKPVVEPIKTQATASPEKILARESNKKTTLTKNIPENSLNMPSSLKEDEFIMPYMYEQFNQPTSLISQLKSKSRHKGLYFPSAIPLGPPIRQHPSSPSIYPVETAPKLKNRCNKPTNVVHIEIQADDVSLNKGRPLIRQALPNVNISARQAASSKKPKKNIQFVTITATELDDRANKMTASVGTSTFEDNIMSRDQQESALHNDSIQCEENPKFPEAVIVEDTERGHKRKAHGNLSDESIYHTVVSKLASELKEHIVNKLLEDSKNQILKTLEKPLDETEEVADMVHKEKSSDCEGHEAVKMNIQEEKKNEENSDIYGEDVTAIADNDVGGDIETDNDVNEDAVEKDGNSFEQDPANDIVVEIQSTHSTHEEANEVNLLDRISPGSTSLSANQINDEQDNKVSLMFSNGKNNDQNVIVENDSEIDNEIRTHPVNPTTDGSVQVPSAPPSPILKEDVSMQFCEDANEISVQVTPSLCQVHCQDASIQISSGLRRTRSASDVTSGLSTTFTDEPVSDGELLSVRPLPNHFGHSPLEESPWQPRQHHSTAVDYTLDDMADLDPDDVDNTLSEGEIPQPENHGRTLPFSLQNGIHQVSDPHSTSELSPGVFHRSVSVPLGSQSPSINDVSHLSSLKGESSSNEQLSEGQVKLSH